MDARTPGQIAARRAVDLLGGPVAAARTLRVKDERHQTVQSWLANRVPAEYCPLIEEATRAIAAEKGGEPVTCEELRPDIAWRVLREQVTPSEPFAPPTPALAVHPAASQHDIDTILYGATARPTLNLEGRANAELGVTYGFGGPVVAPVKRVQGASDKPNRGGRGER